MLPMPSNSEYEPAQVVCCVLVGASKGECWPRWTTGLGLLEIGVALSAKERENKIYQTKAASFIQRFDQRRQWNNSSPPAAAIVYATVALNPIDPVMTSGQPAPPKKSIKVSSSSWQWLKTISGCVREHSASQAKKLMQKLLTPPSDSTRKRAVSLAQHPQPYSAPPTVFHARKNLSQDGRETGRWDDRCLLHDPVLFRVAVNVTVRRFVYVFRQKVPKLFCKCD